MPGVSTGMLLYQVSGADPSKPVQLMLPNGQGWKPGSVLNLVTFNPITGGHDVTGRMIVSADGKTMTSIGLITLAAGSGS